MLHFLPLWLLKFLQKLSLENLTARRSIRGLLSLWGLLLRRFRRSSDKPPPSGITTSLETIRLDGVTVCPSTQPPLSMWGYSPFQTEFDSNLSPSHGSEFLDSGSFSGPGSSLSPQELEMAWIEANGPNNSPSHHLSTIPARSVPSTRAPSPAPSHTSHIIPVGSVAASSRVSLSGLRSKLFPIVPQQFKRYERNVIIPNCHSHYTIEPVTLDYAPDKILSGWEAFMHPEGALYFHWSDKIVSESITKSIMSIKSVFTDAHLYDDQVLSAVNDIISQIEEFLRTHNLELALNVDLVLDLTHDANGGVDCGYYLADHKKRLVFWLDQYDISDVIAEVRGASLRPHIGLEIESQYWYHCELFPSSRKLSIEVVDELRDAIIHATGDLLSSPVSTAPFNIGDLEKMLRLINNIKANVGTQYGGSACLLARFMSNFFHCRFMNFHGQNGARLCRDQSVHGDPTTRESSYLMNIISPMLFYTPHTYLHTLAKISVDRIVSRVSWCETIDKLTSEWQESTLYSTVLLNANVALLAISSVDSAGTENYRSPTQISSYLSAVVSIGSVIFALLLVQQHRQKADLDFFTNRMASWFDLETLAILYSLPYALLMWGMVSFFVAISFVCFQTPYRLSRSLVGGCELAVVILIFWCISVRWEANPNSSWSFPAWKPWKQTTISKFCGERQWSWPSPFRVMRRLLWSAPASSSLPTIQV